MRDALNVNALYMLTGVRSKIYLVLRVSAEISGRQSMEQGVHCWKSKGTSWYLLDRRE